MPLASEDQFFGAKKGSANKALQGLVKQYGLSEGTRIFYAMLNERRKARKAYAAAKRP